MTEENAGHSTVYRIRGKRSTCCDLDLFCFSCPTKRSHPSDTSSLFSFGDIGPDRSSGQVSRRSLGLSRPVSDSPYKIVDVHPDQFLDIAQRAQPQLAAAVQGRIRVLTLLKDYLDSRNSYKK